jgi:hypothetical protein
MLAKIENKLRKESWSSRPKLKMKKYLQDGPNNQLILSINY